MLIILWIIMFGGTSAFIASSKGRSGLAWFLLGSLFGIFALVAVIAVPSIEADTAQKGN